MWASSTALLTFVLCLLSLHCACGFPAPRTAPKSARQDDLISGSDFLSVFIGAASRKTGSRPRDPQQDDGNSDLDSMIEAFSSESSGFGTRTKPRGEGAPPPRSSKDPMSLIFDVENTRDKGGLDEVGEVSTTPEDITSTLPQDYKLSRKKETPKHFSLTFTSSRDISKSLPPSEDSTDYNSNAPETSTVPEFYTESPTLKPSSVTILLENQEAAADEQGTESVNTPANEFTTDQSNYFTEAATFNQDQGTTTDVPLNDEFAEISRISELTDIKKINQQSPRPTVITKSKRLHVHSNSAPGNAYYASVTSPDILREDAQRTSESPTFYEVHQDNISLLPRNKTHQVISVRVSSTVVLAPGHTTSKIQETTKGEDTEQNKEILKKYVDAFPENADYTGVQPPGNSISLVTEEQPAATAIQRSQFIVEESQPSSSEVATFPNKPSDLSQHQTIYVATSSHSREPLPDPQTHPVSYQTSISSATSGSRVQFYSEPPNYRKPSAMAESVQQTVVTSHQPEQQSRFGQKVHTSVGGQGTQFGRSPSGDQYTPQHPGSFSVSVNRYQQQQQAPKKDNPDREQKSYHGNSHQEPVEQNYEEQEQNYGTPERVYGEREKNYEEPEMNYGVPERNYGMPEQNYEVDEAVSVMSNGRVHGVQTPPSVTPHNTDHGTTPVTAEQNDPNHKFGYVVEGRNFRKYRVEERTPDGFIVGEYGVVSHDDGSLRGVRYTADSTINPKLIYEALVKFLSL